MRLFLCSLGGARSRSGRAYLNAGHHQPLRNGFEHMLNEILDLRHDVGRSCFGLCLSLLVRGADLLLKTLCSPVWKARLIALRRQ